MPHRPPFPSPYPASVVGGGTSWGLGRRASPPGSPRSRTGTQGAGPEPALPQSDCRAPRGRPRSRSEPPGQGPCFRTMGAAGRGLMGGPSPGAVAAAAVPVVLAVAGPSHLRPVVGHPHQTAADILGPSWCTIRGSGEDLDCCGWMRAGCGVVLFTSLLRNSPGAVGCASPFGPVNAGAGGV